MITYKSLIEKQMAVFVNEKNTPQGYYRFYQSYVLSAILLKKLDNNHIKEINHKLQNFFIALERKRNVSNHLLILSQQIEIDRPIITEFLESCKDIDIDEELQENIEYIPGAIAYEDQKEIDIFRVFRPPHAHAETDYTFIDMYSKEYELRSYKELFDEMKKYKEEQALIFIEKMKGLYSKKDKKTNTETKTQSEKDNLQIAYNLKLKNMKRGWKDIGTEMGMSEHTVKKYALRFALKKKDHEFIEQFTRQRKK